MKWKHLSAHLSLTQGQLIVYPCSGIRCRRSQQFQTSPLKPLGKFKLDFNDVEPTWVGGSKVCINGTGHMTKMAVIPISGKHI